MNMTIKKMGVTNFTKFLMIQRKTFKNGICIRGIKKKHIPTIREVDTNN